MVGRRSSSSPRSAGRRRPPRRLRAFGLGLRAHGGDHGAQGRVVGAGGVHLGCRRDLSARAAPRWRGPRGCCWIWTSRLSIARAKRASGLDGVLELAPQGDDLVADVGGQRGADLLHRRRLGLCLRRLARAVVSKEGMSPTIVSAMSCHDDQPQRVVEIDGMSGGRMQASWHQRPIIQEMCSATLSRRPSAEPGMAISRFQALGEAS